MGPVVTGAGNMRVILAIYIVAVHKVEAAVLVDTMPHGVVDSLLNIVPAHVGDFEFCALGILQVVAKEFDLPGNSPDSLRRHFLHCAPSVPACLHRSPALVLF